MWGFLLKPDFSHVRHKIPFWIPKYIISFLSTQWHSFSGLHTTHDGFALNLILWLQRYFWLETLFVVIFGPNIDLTNQLLALPMVKTLNGKIFTWAPFLPIYEIYFLLFLHENLVTFLNLHFVAKKSSSELRIIFFFLYFR